MRASRPDADQSAFANRPTCNPFDYDILGFFRKWLAIIYTVARIFVDIVIFIVQTIMYFASIFWPWLAVFIIITIIWYLVVIYWVYVIKLVLDVAIPLVNLGITLFNFAVILFIVIWDIAVTIWNCIVPLIGMIIYVIMDIIATVLSDIFEIIGSIDWEPIVSAFMGILNIVVEIVMQILIIIIKVGAEILKFVAQIIGPILEIFMEFVQIWVVLIQWVFELLFKILEPILLILGAFFGGGGQSEGDDNFSGPDYTSKGSSSTARRLLELDRFKLSSVEEEQIIADYHRHMFAIPEGLTEKEAKTLAMIVKDKIAEEHQMADNALNPLFANLYKAIREAEEDDNPFKSLVGKRKRNDVEFIDESVPRQEREDVEESAGKRRLHSIQKPWKTGKQDGLRFASDTLKEESVHLDDVAHTVAHAFYTTSKELPQDIYQRMRSTANTVNEEVTRKKHLGLSNLHIRIGQKYNHLLPAPSERLSSVIYEQPVNPISLVPSFHGETTRRYKEQLERNGGRRLLVNYKDVEAERMSGVRMEQAKQIIAAYDEYYAHHDLRVKVAMVTYSAATRSLKRSMTEVVTPQLLIKHYSAVLDSFGYKSIQDVRRDFTDRYGDPWGFLVNVSSVANHPVLRILQRADPSRTESPFFHDWVAENKKLGEEREQRIGRRLFSSEGDVQGSGTSSDALSGFATKADLNCFSSPKHPLCLPLIPMNTKFKIPLIRLTDRQKEMIANPTIHCAPWRFTNCIVCADRLYNALVEVVFIFSAIPPINFALATLLEIVPWAKVFIDWIFIVPKYATASIHQWVCFAFHLYDLYITLVLVWLAWHIVVPLYRLLLQWLRNVQYIVNSGKGEHYFWEKCIARSVHKRIAEQRYQGYTGRFNRDRQGYDNDGFSIAYLNDSDDDDEEDNSDEAPIQSRIRMRRRETRMKPREKRDIHDMSASERRSLRILKKLSKDTRTTNDIDRRTLELIRNFLNEYVDIDHDHRIDDRSYQQSKLHIEKDATYMRHKHE